MVGIIVDLRKRVPKTAYDFLSWDGHLHSLDRRDGKTRSKLPLDFHDWAPTPLVWKGRLILAFRRRLVAVGEAEGGRGNR